MASPDVATLVGHLLPLTHQASSIVYTPTSPLTATDVQSALDQLAGWAHSGSGTDNAIVRWDGTSNIQDSAVQIEDTTGKISTLSSNSNLILDGNGTGKVQLNTGSNSQQFPKNRPGSAGTLLTINNSNGDMSWALAATFYPTWQNVHDTSFGREYFQLRTETFRVQEATAAFGSGTPMFAVSNEALTKNYFASNQVAFWSDGSGANPVFYFDRANIRCGIGVNANNNTIVLGGVTYGSLFTANSEGTTDLLNVTIHRHSATAGFGGYLGFVRSRGDATTPTVVVTNDTLARLDALAHDGTDYAISSRIEFSCEGTIAANQIPGIIYFRTANASGTLTTALTLNSSQKATFSGAIAVDNFLIGGTANTLESTNTNGNIIFDPNGTGAIQLSGPTELGLQLLKFGSANEADMFFDTGLVINPKVSGTGVLTIGSATGTGDGNIVINKMGIGGNAISVNSYIEGVITGNGRGILNFQLTFTGAGNSAAVSASYLTDQGSGPNFSGICFHAQPKGDAHTHSGNTTYYGFYCQAGLTSSFNVSAGTHTTYGARLDVDPFGDGGTVTGGTFRRYGLFISAVAAITGTPGSDLIMGIYSGESINMPTNRKLYFDSTTTALGTTYIYRSTTNTRLEVFENATLVFDFDSTINQSEVPLGVLAGTSTTYAKVGGTVEVNTTGVGTPANTTETDLQTFSVPANSMATNGDSIYFEMSFTTAANANTKRLKIKYGATTMYDSTALALNNSVITVRGRIIRTGAATQNYYIEVHSSSALLVATSAQGTAAETLSGAVTLKATGQNGTATASDLVETNSYIQFSPNK